jgi:hypothetical protein
MHVTLHEIQLATLTCIAANSDLRNVLVVRGSAAINIFYRGKRPAKDLDFLALNLDGEHPTLSSPDELKNRLNALLNRDLLSRPGYRDQVDWIRGNLIIDIGRCNILTDCCPLHIPDSQLHIKVCTLEDIIAQKLGAILQPSPKHNGEQDLFDIAWALTSERPLNWQRLKELAHGKAKRRGCKVESASYDSDVQARLRSNYGVLQPTLTTNFIAFDDAISLLLDLVERIQ